MTSTPQQQLDQMNAEILKLQRKRKAWMKENYLSFADFKVGDRIYAKVAANDYKLQCAGIVTKVYTTSGVESTTVDVHYAFDRAPGYHYASDTEGGWAYYYTQAQYERIVREEIERLQRQLKPSETRETVR